MHVVGGRVLPSTSRQGPWQEKPPSSASYPEGRPTAQEAPGLSAYSPLGPGARAPPPTLGAGLRCPSSVTPPQLLSSPRFRQDQPGFTERGTLTGRGGVSRPDARAGGAGGGAVQGPENTQEAVAARGLGRGFQRAWSEWTPSPGTELSRIRSEEPPSLLLESRTWRRVKTRCAAGRVPSAARSRPLGPSREVPRPERHSEAAAALPWARGAHRVAAVAAVGRREHPSGRSLQAPRGRGVRGAGRSDMPRSHRRLSRVPSPSAEPPRLRAWAPPPRGLRCTGNVQWAAGFPKAQGSGGASAPQQCRAPTGQALTARGRAGPRLHVVRPAASGAEWEGGSQP